MIDGHIDAKLAECSVIAYQDRDEAEANLQRLNYTRVSWFSSRGTEAYIASGDVRTVIAFRGTEPTHLEDWQADIRCNRVAHPFGAVHKGFAIAYLAVAKKLFSELKHHNREAIYVTGHSLGAALATLCTAELCQTNLIPKGLCTFGSPRVGDYRFATTLAPLCPIRRYVNNNDIVTRCPSPIRFWHVGSVIYINSHGKVVHNPTQPYRLYDRLRGYAVDVGTIGMDGVKDHSMVRYCQHLSREYGHATTLDLASL